MTPDGFYVQGIEGDFAWVQTGTPFGIFPVGDEAIAGFAVEGEPGTVYPLFKGTPEACREYLSHLPMMFQQAGIPTVLTQHFQSREQAAAAQDDAVRWGGGS